MNGKTIRNIERVSTLIIRGYEIISSSFRRDCRQPRCRLLPSWGGPRSNRQLRRYGVRGFLAWQPSAWPTAILIPSWPWPIRRCCGTITQVHVRLHSTAGVKFILPEKQILLAVCDLNHVLPCVEIARSSDNCCTQKSISYVTVGRDFWDQVWVEHVNR